MDALKIALEVGLVLGGIFLTFLILMHKGKGGGMSDMFGGGFASTMGSSTVAERNLNRLTIAVAVLWFVCIVGIQLLERFKG